MLDHLALQVTDVDAATAFYLRVFAPLGMRQAGPSPGATGQPGPG